MLFLNIKQSPDARGMPRASLRIERPSFPVRFDIGAEHVPLQVDNKGDMLLGDLWFVARLDGDGNARSRATCPPSRARSPPVASPSP